MWKTQVVDELAILLRKAQGPFVYVYRLDWDELRTLFTLGLGGLFGAGHALEIPFVFGNFAGIDRTMVIIYNNVPARDALSRSMMFYGSEFAYSGNPGRGRDGSETAWTSWENGGESADRILILDSVNDRGVRMVPTRFTVESIRKRSIADTSFRSQEDHCGLYFRLFEGEKFDPSEYKTLGKTGCVS